MHTEPHDGEVRHHKPRHLAERLEGALGTLMVVAIVLLALGLIYGMVTGGGGTPRWLQ